MNVTKLKTSQWRYVAIAMTAEEIALLKSGKSLEVEVEDGKVLRIVCHESIKSAMPTSMVLAKGARFVAMLRGRFLDGCLESPRAVEIVDESESDYRVRFQFFCESQIKASDVLNQRVVVVEG